MRTVSLRIREIDERHLPSVIRAFVCSLPIVCSDIIDSDGRLQLRDMATAILAISAMESQFWSSNPYVRAHIVSLFPRLYAWVLLSGEAVVRNSYLIQGSNRRQKTLDLIHNIFQIMRNVGDIGVRFIFDQFIWKDALSIWGRTQNCSFVEEYKIAAIFLHAHESFIQDSVPAFTQNVLTTLQAFGLDAGAIMAMALARTHRAIVDDTGPESESDCIIRQQLLVLRALIDDPHSPLDGSPFHLAFFSQKGLQHILETMTYCASSSRWGSVDICIAIVVGLLGRTRSHTMFRFALYGGLIRRVMQISINTPMLSDIGHTGISFLLRQFLPEVILSPSIAELATELEMQSPEEISILSSSEYLQDWLRLFNLRRHFFYAYRNLERLSGKEYERCGNVRIFFHDVLVASGIRG